MGNFTYYLSQCIQPKTIELLGGGLRVDFLPLFRGSVTLIGVTESARPASDPLDFTFTFTFTLQCCLASGSRLKAAS